MRLTSKLILRAGFVMLGLSIISYLSAIWSSELISDRLGLTGVTFMVAGLAFLIIYAFMGKGWTELTTKGGDNDDF